MIVPVLHFDIPGLKNGQFHELLFVVKWNCLAELERTKQQQSLLIAAYSTIYFKIDGAK
jgi:hypothetical protein